MLNNLFYKRKKIQDQRLPSLQHLKGFRNRYEDACKDREAKTILSIDKSLSKAISGLKDLSSLHSRQEKLFDAQVFALADALLSFPIISRLDLRDSSITDNGARGLLELLRLQIMQAKDFSLVKKELSWEQTKFMTQIKLSGNKITGSILKEIETYLKILRREDKRLEIRVVMQQVGRGSYGVAVTPGTTIMDSGFRTARGVSTGMEEEDLKTILKLLTGADPSKRECKALLDQISAYILSGSEYAMRIEDLLLATCFNSPSYNNAEATPPWEALVQQQHANLQSLNDEDRQIEGSVLFESDPVNAPVNMEMHIDTSFSESEASVVKLADFYQSPNSAASIHPTEFVKKSVRNRRSRAVESYDETTPMFDALKQLHRGHQETESVVYGDAIRDTPILDTSSEDSDRSLQRGYDMDPHDDRGDLCAIESVDQPELVGVPQAAENREEIPSVIVVDVKYQGKDSHILKMLDTQASRSLLHQLAPTIPFHSLVVLVVSGIHLERFQIFQRCKLPLLVALDASDNKLRNIRTDDWKGISKNLKVINLAENQFRCIPELHLCLQLQALSLSHNRIKAVNNLELCRKLRNLDLSFNNIGSCHALRPLSVNIELSHLDLGGNPLWEALDKDEKMRRRVGIQISNLIPNLQTIGFIVNGTLMSKKIRKRGNPSLVDVQALPDPAKKPSLLATLEDGQALWIARACDSIECYADVEDNADQPDKNTQDSAPRISRQEQTLRDKERSYFVPYRSRGKSPDSPRREVFQKQVPGWREDSEQQKASVKGDKSQHATSSLHQRQSLSKLSAPKHPPLSLSEVKAIREAEPRHCFLTNHATVAEKVESRKPLQPQRSSQKISATRKRKPPKKSDKKSLKITVYDEKPSAPQREEVTQEGRSSNGSFEPKTQTRTHDTCTPTTHAFLHELAVEKFHSHLEEQIATATTALSILLDMSENTQVDSSKLVQYRSSLAQIDILNEGETNRLMRDLEGSCTTFTPSLLDRYKECNPKFSQLREVKQSLALILKTLDKHFPGSAQVRSICSSFRASDNLLQKDSISDPPPPLKHESTLAVTIAEECIESGNRTNVRGMESDEDEIVEEYDFLSSETSSDFSKLFDSSMQAGDPMTCDQHKKSLDRPSIVASSTQEGDTEVLVDTLSIDVESRSIVTTESMDSVRLGNSIEETLGLFDNAREDETVQIFEDWERSFDSDTNHFFWYNHSSGESQWEPPEGWPFQIEAPFSIETSSHINRDLGNVTREFDGEDEVGYDCFDDDVSLPGF